jgi:hypothetical protein
MGSSAKKKDPLQLLGKNHQGVDHGREGLLGHAEVHDLATSPFEKKTFNDSFNYKIYNGKQT